MSVGGGKGSSDQVNSSQSQGEAWSNSLGLGENVSFGQQGAANQADSWNQSSNLSNAQSTQDSNSFSQSGSYVDPSQAGYLDSLRKNAQSAYAASGATLNPFNQDLMGQGQQALGNLQSLGDATGVATAQLEGLRSGLDDMFGQGLNQIGANASSAGAFGGSRQALQEAALGGEIAKAYTQGYGDIMANANNQAITANNAAIAGLSPLYNLGMGSQFGSLGALQSLLGDTTVLQAATSGSQSTGQSTSDSIGTAAGGSTSTGSSFGQDFGYGYDYNTSDSYAYDQSQSRGRAEEDNARFGFGIK